MCWWCICGRSDELEASAFQKMIEDNKHTEENRTLQLVDVRTGWEYEGGHIAGTIHCDFLANIPTFKSRLAALGLDPDKPVYTICASAHRSIAANRALRELGFEAIQLKAGMQAWRKKNLPEVTNKPQEKTT